ncbi:MAG: tRNA preQ1(34) S-adenosylmethionine ribosyltransferase-isomerase QueA [Deltaproteobacteria bacterium]|nr:tRNA preQ1(34) S-adenosylmethionine ribosyltransferase-isomerase QueA [Deltaproteobacteria bacterium]
MSATEKSIPLPAFHFSDEDDWLKNYNFDLPKSHIATRPLEKRSASRLLHVPAEGDASHCTFLDIKKLLSPGDCLVMNDTSVLPARLLAEKAETGGHVEILLCREELDGSWIAMLKASKTPKAGTRLVLGLRGSTPDPFFATVLGRADDEPGCFRLQFDGDARAFAKAVGSIPIPPYFERDDDDDDRHRYQTVYANQAKQGAAAAPTAGFHFDQDLLDDLDELGVRRTMVTLHVGPGTFMPVREERLHNHEMHAEPWEISAAAAATLNETRKRGGRIIAVGTTSLRTLETAVLDDGSFVADQGLSRIFLHPGGKFHAVDGLLTNFHLPESSLLMLVSALTGRERILSAYQAAIENNYRFYSFGDACLLEVHPEARAI